MRFKDRFGHTLTTTNADAPDRYDNAVESLLRFGDDVVDKWDATVADDDFVMGRIGQAYLRCLSSEAPDAAEAGASLAEIDGSRLTDRERRHLDAARAYASGDLHGAAERLEVLTVEFPRDALALAVGHQLDFFRADALGLRDRLGGALLSWDESDPWFGFLLGMQAFGLEECGLYPQAESAGMRALEREPRDVWAHHAVMHVYEMQGRIETGLRFAESRRADWEHDNFFVPHNAWHEALMHLENNDNASAFAIYDRVLHHAESDGVALEMLDAASLLWRLHLRGDDVGDRWEPLADAWAKKSEQRWYVFNDMHATMAFVGAGRLDDAHALVDRLERYIAADHGRPVANVAMTAEVGLPVCSAILDFGEGRYQEAISRLRPIRKIIQRFGGSHAQRDVVARTLLEASIRSNDQALATTLLSERMAINERSPFNRLQLARIRRAGEDVATGQIETVPA